MHTETPITYYVWRRSDGYVDATCYDPNHASGCKPDEHYDVLLITEDWDGEAKPLIERSRKPEADAAAPRRSRPRRSVR